MTIYICPGVHDRHLSQSGLQALDLPRHRCLVLPTDTHPPYSPFHVFQFLQQQEISPTDPLIFLSFSAGVVGAIATAWGWRQLGGTVTAFFACDGWGVPLFGDFPIYRISHDLQTHRESSFLGAGDDRFYADPPVSHLELWERPDRAEGWWVTPDGIRSRRTTAAEFIRDLLQIHEELL
ncbi:hypothetical protein [Baaleninema sp.]|uniref:hypothetical protein n=1 Tax=Baaleninema sp. TaxID=3101197 RepID=UPI003D060EC7